MGVISINSYGDIFCFNSIRKKPQLNLVCVCESGDIAHFLQHMTGITRFAIGKQTEKVYLVLFLSFI